MTTAFLAISAAVKAALVAATPVLRADRVRCGRRLTVPVGWSQAIDILILRSTATVADLAGTTLAWDSLIGIEISARAEAGVDGETAVDALLAATFARLATTDAPDGVISWTLQPTVQWDVDEADTTVVRASLQLRVTHHTDIALAALA